jgi:hypothetical protein
MAMHSTGQALAQSEQPVQPWLGLSSGYALFRESIPVLFNTRQPNGQVPTHMPHAMQVE